MRRLLSLDLGTKTGFSIFEVIEDQKNIWKYVKSGVRNFSKEKSGERFYSFFAWLNELLENEKIDQIFYEKVWAHSGVQASHMYGGFEAIVLCFAFFKNIGAEGLGVTTIKRRVTGCGSASKDKVLQAVNARLSTFIVDDNEGDAVAVMLAKQAEYF